MKQNGTYDAVVVGAGIHGAGVAQLLAANGYSVLVLEQTGVAAGTSSRSSKLIHGGLRYLESGQLGLVRECLKERATLLRIAPGLVRLRSFYIPVYGYSRRPAWVIRCGLLLYSLLAGFQASTRFRQLPRQEWGTLDGLATTGLTHVFEYKDGQTDDIALTKAVMASAQSFGARLCSPARFYHAQCHDGRYTVGYRTASEESKQCDTRVLINAAGPWVNEVLDKIDPKQKKLPINLVQGTHIIISGGLREGIYYMEAPQDGRPIFAIPWGQDTLVGTTETAFTGRPEDVCPLEQEITYLQKAFSHYFPAGLGNNHTVLDAFSGLRVLPVGDNTFAKRKRETVLHLQRNQGCMCLTIYGGKLTGYRKTAERVLEQVAGHLPKREAHRRSCNILLT